MGASASISKRTFSISAKSFSLSSNEGSSSLKDKKINNTLPFAAERDSCYKSDRTKLTTIRLILDNKRFLLPFLDLLTQYEKREVYDFFEALETLKKLIPQQSCKSMEYDYRGFISSHELLSQIYFHPTDFQYTTAITNEEVHETVLTALQPILQYQDKMINGLTLYSMISHCQNALTMELIPEFDEYVESKYFQQVRILRTKSTKQFNDDYEEHCLRPTFTRSSSFSNDLQHNHQNTNSSSSRLETITVVG